MPVFHVSHPGNNDGLPTVNEDSAPHPNAECTPMSPAMCSRIPLLATVPEKKYNDGQPLSRPKAKVSRKNHHTTQVSVEEIQQDISAFLQRVEVGGTLLMVQTGKPIAEIKPVVGPPQA
jgi:hypothetical protein